MTKVRLPDFIKSNVEPILAEWEAFARSIWPADSQADPVELRNSAAEILRAVVDDMAQAQTPQEQSRKSRGQGASGRESDHLDDASEVRGAARVASGLSILEVVSEYRALRASILRLWRSSRPDPDARDIVDITRFNESVDQSLTRAIASFTKRPDTSRQMFLAMLGHDLRSPLSAITLTARVAQHEPSLGPALAESLSQIVSSARTISKLVADLIDFTSSTMGVRLPLSTGPTDLRAVCADVIAELHAGNPGREIRLSANGDQAGRWDAHRLRQVFANLLGNALQHGSPTDPVRLTIDGSAGDSVVITVHNAGEPIPREVLPTIFDPLVRGRTSVHAPGSIGLGLYIAREIVVAHGGTITLTSSVADGTTATVRLPRQAPPEAQRMRRPPRKA